VLWSLTSGISEADGKAEAELRIPDTEDLEPTISEYSRKVLGRQ